MHSKHYILQQESPISRIRRRTTSRSQVVPTPVVIHSTINSTWGDGTNFHPRPTQFVPPLGRFHRSFNADSDSTPFQLLRMFIDDDMVDTICLESNDYTPVIKAKFPKALKRWTPLSRQEFWKFMGLSTLMGIVKKGDVKDYWSTDELISTPIFGKTMSRDRFTDIMRALHFQNDGNIPTGNIDRFIKLGSFFPSLMSKFKNFVIPGEYLYIDESLMPFKGRLSFKQYVPSKRARFGVKFYILVDCATKAVLALLPYQGKKTIFAAPKDIFGVGEKAM
ncbi:piggyBac transposable element-derived protein 4-like [Folsomia candida]|uniref:piggyBac transposable element-derived protein 4-like n=1 Tax=Folsomia candida TaxID=158441 RepID=UPI00160519F5|nr:piggyBac transposable element-derived protein 4-like [Folsomia candida]